MIALVAAPTNLGLRPPQPGSVPGAAKAPEALREAGLHVRMAQRGAVDAGVVLPGRYVDDDATRPPRHVRNERALVDHARRLARRLDRVRESGAAPLVIGGDCSLLIGAGLMTRGGAGRGLVHVDGHTDFRHPALTPDCASVAGEDLAAAIGLHWPAISGIDGRGPYFEASRTVHIGCRDDDADLELVQATIGAVIPAADVIRDGAAQAAQRARAVADTGAGYWLQVDVDVLDPEVMPAVDSPSPGGLRADELVELLRGLAPRASGASVTVFDPDLDPDGRYAETLTDVLVEGFAELATAFG
ncbi:arginase family protein [Microbacterium timonense]|uniref:arginase family protein n=1 Tax=Microbacterium timonense TaxID=2086576 RepID=UPI000D113DBD|nr:arginase family protein [Microbacterium timonense]